LKGLTESASGCMHTYNWRRNRVEWRWCNL